MRSRGRTQQSATLPTPPQRIYLSELGEDDLLARSIVNTPVGAFVGLLVMLLLVGIGVVFGATLLSESDSSDDNGVVEVVTTVMTTDTPTPSLSPFPTNTRPALQTYPTVTPLPPTATPTPTEGPCVQRAVAGDTVYGLAQRCGHRNFSVVDVIVEENAGLACAQCLQEGQEIIIPWPTPTLGVPDSGIDNEASFNPADNTNIRGDVVVASNSNAAVAAQSEAFNEFGTPDVLATFFVEPTLRPGLQWHTVSENENMIIIAQRYDADAKVLSDINPEIDFAQCDFSERYGGPNCSVFLRPGQRVRVPAPSPTPTLSPTPSGSLTPTPTLTPTFNAPIALSPRDGDEFDRNSLVTLRWSALGTLEVNEAYIVTVRQLNKRDDVNDDIIYREQTSELLFVVPNEWQATGSDYYEFEWTVAIATLDAENVVTSQRERTQPRTFAWQGRN